MSLFAMFGPAGPTGFGHWPTAEQVYRGALARRPNHSGDGLQLRHRAGGMSGTGAAGGAGGRGPRAPRRRPRRRARCFPARRSVTPASSQTLRRCEGASQRCKGRRSPARRHHLQRRHHDAAHVADRARLRAAVLHQPHRSLHAGDRPPRSAQQTRAAW